MGRYHDFDEEFARADQREKELQRQLGMDDGVSTPRPASTPQQGFGGYNNTPGGFGNNNDLLTRQRTKADGNKTGGEHGGASFMKQGFVERSSTS
jgi:hypothetical protein